MKERGKETAGMPEPVEQVASSARGAWVFGDFTLDLGGGRLLRGEDEIPLRPKSFAVLEHLVGNAQRLVSRDELLSAVWRDTIVTDDSLTHCIADIRRALGKDGAAIVRTVPRRGYVLTLPVARAPEKRHDTPGLTQPTVSDGPAVSANVRSRPGWPSRLIVAGCALSIVLAVAWWAGRGAFAPETPVVVQTLPNSIAVLRFTDMSETQDLAYLGEGLADEILHLLAQAPELIVIARTSSFAMDGEDVATVAAALNVAYVLEGSVRRSGDRLRVTAQLVDTATSAHVWSKIYEGDLDEVIAVETEIAGAVAETLHVTLVHGGQPADSLRDARAHELFLRGHFFYNRRAPGDIERAKELYEQVLEIDPEFARAWVGLAAIYNLGRVGRWTARPDLDANTVADDARYRDIDERHRQAVERALRLAPDLPEVHARAAVYYTWVGDLAKRFEHLERARALDANHPLVLGLLHAQHRWGNRLDASIEVMQRAVLRDPLSAVTRSNLADGLLVADRLEEALAEYRKVLELGPALSGDDGRVDGAVFGIGIVLLRQEKFDEALEWIESWPPGGDRDYAAAMLEHARDRPAEADAALQRLIASAGTREPLRIAEVYAYRGEVDEALAWLQRVPGHAGCRRTLIRTAFYSPFLARMRGDARWEAWRTDTAAKMQECDYRFNLPT